MAVNVTVTFSGPLFTDDLDSRIRLGTSLIVRKIMELGDEHLGQMLRKEPEGVYLAEGGSTGNYRRNVTTAFVGDGLHGLITDGDVIYGPWLEGVSSRNETTRFKGYSAFRQTEQWLQEQATTVAEEQVQMIAAELRG